MKDYGASLEWPQPPRALNQTANKFKVYSGGKLISFGTATKSTMKKKGTHSTPILAGHFQPVAGLPGAEAGARRGPGHAAPEDAGPRAAGRSTLVLGHR